MIKVLMLIDSLRCGGKERRLVELLRGLQDYPDIQCEIAVMNKTVFYEDVFDLGVKIHFLRRRIKKDPLVFFSLYKICRKFKPDVIHSWGGMEAVYASLVAKIMTIGLINGMVTHATPKKKSSKGYIYGRLSFPFSDVVLANSFAGLRVVGAPERKKCCIQNGFDFGRIEKLKDKDSVRREFKIDTPKVVGMVGAVIQGRKDFLTFISAAEILLEKDKDITFLVVGTGKSMDDYRTRIRPENRDRIKFLGNQRNVESVINIFDVAVLCSYFEGFSNVIMEYMGIGKPVVATDTGGNPELILDGKTGYLVPVRNVEAVAGKIGYLLANPEAAEKMGEAGRKRIEKFFSLEIMVDKYDRLYNIVYKRKRQSIGNLLEELSGVGRMNHGGNVRPEAEE